MPIHRATTGIPPIRKDSLVEPTRQTTLPVAPHKPNHDRTISTLNNVIQAIDTIGALVPTQMGKGVLQSITGILAIVKNTFLNQVDFDELAGQCHMIGLVVGQATYGTSESQLNANVRRALSDLTRSINGIREAVEAKAEKSLRSQVFHIAVNQETIVKWRNELNHALTLFNMELNIATNMKLNELSAAFENLCTRMPVAHNSSSDIEAPSVLPARPRIFVGRDDLVQSTMSPLLDCRHVALIGPGGIGKSSIARAVLNDEIIISKFQDRRFFARFDDIDAAQVNLATFLDRVARALGLRAGAHAHDRIMRALSVSDTLLVLDNAETFLDATEDAGRIAGAIDDFGARHNVAILLTTRTSVLPPNLDWARLLVPALEDSAACEAFKAFYPSIETSVLTELLSAVDFHPLSINLLAQAAVQNMWSPQDLMTAWDRQRTALLEAGQEKIQSIAVTIETSLNSPSFIKLGEKVHHLLQIIAFLPQGISKIRLTAILPRVSNIETCADALCRQSLAYVNGDFITLLAPIRLYISKRYNTEISMNPLLKSVRLYYGAHVEEKQIVGQDDVNIEHVLSHWLVDTEIVSDVLGHISDFVVTLGGCWPRAVSFFPVVSALDISKPYCSTSCTSLSKVFFIFRRLSGLPLAKAWCLITISALMLLTGHMKEAEEAYAEARALVLDAGNSNSLAGMDWILAIQYADQGNFQTAEEYFQTALKRLSRSSALFRPNRLLSASIKVNLLRLDIIKGRPDALHDYTVALPMLKKQCHGDDMASLNIVAGFAALHRGHLDSAQEYFKELQANVNQDEPMCQFLASIGLAEVADQQCDHVGSKALRTHLLESVQRIPDQSIGYVNELMALLAGYLAMEGNVGRARELIIPTVRNATKYLSLDVLKCKYLAGMIELIDRDFDRAEGYFRGTIEDCLSLAELLYRARSFRALGEIAVVKQDMIAAKKHFEATTELCKTMCLPEERLYFDYSCCIPSETFVGWRLYQEANPIFCTLDVVTA